MPEQYERGAPRDLLAAHQITRALEDDVGHPLEGPQRPSVADSLVTLLCHGSLEAELPRYDLLGKVALGDEGRDDVDLLGLDGVQHVPNGGFFFPEALDDLVELPGLPDALRVLVDRQARVLV